MYSNLTVTILEFKVITFRVMLKLRDSLYEKQAQSTLVRFGELP